MINADFAVSALTLLVGRQEGHNGFQKQEAQLMLMLTNTRDVQSIYSVDIPVSLHLLQKKALRETQNLRAGCSKAAQLLDVAKRPISQG